MFTGVPLLYAAYFIIHYAFHHGYAILTVNSFKYKKVLMPIRKPKSNLKKYAAHSNGTPVNIICLMIEEDDR